MPFAISYLVHSLNHCSFCTFFCKTMIYYTHRDHYLQFVRWLFKLNWAKWSHWHLSPLWRMATLATRVVGLWRALSTEQCTVCRRRKACPCWWGGDGKPPMFLDTFDTESLQSRLRVQMQLEIRQFRNSTTEAKGTTNRSKEVWHMDWSSAFPGMALVLWMTWVSCTLKYQSVQSVASLGNLALNIYIFHIMQSTKVYCLDHESQVCAQCSYDMHCFPAGIVTRECVWRVTIYYVSTA